MQISFIARLTAFAGADNHVPKQTVGTQLATAWSNKRVVTVALLPLHASSREMHLHRSGTGKRCAEHAGPFSGWLAGCPSLAQAPSQPLNEALMLSQHRLSTVRLQTQSNVPFQAQLDC